MPRQPYIAQPTGDATRILRIHLLGPSEVVWAERTLPVPRRQVRALLYRLAAGQQPVPREELSYLFWPETPEAAARRNLRGLLAHLRRALPAPNLLMTAGDVVGLDLDHTWSDIVVFERLCSIPEPFAQTETLQQAVDLYRGPFLAGFSLPACPQFEMWAAVERQTWERLYLEALASLIEEQTAKGDYAAAIAFAQRYLTTDDLAEEIHCRLIELYAASGDRSAALRQYEQCLTILERELGVDPLPETQSAYRAVLDGSPSPGTAPVVEATWTTLPELDVPLIGRDSALDQLTKAFTCAHAGHGAVVLISGEAGIGKSRLMQEFATGMQERVLVLSGCGYPDAKTMPYQPIVEALRPALGIQSLRLNVQPAWLAEASRLLPELRDLVPSLPSPLPGEPELTRARLFEALCQLTLALTAAHRPLLLCLDDLHWADKTTLDWLAYLGRKLQGSWLLVLGAFQSEEAGAVSRLRHGLARQGILCELRLERLGQAAILQLLRSLGDPLPSDETSARQLYQATGGNPFFLLETLRAFLESDPETVGHRELAELADLSAAAGLQDASGQALPLPKTIQTAVEARVGRLSAQARQVLEAGAVLSQTFAFDLVQRTAGRGELETINGLDELVARQLLWEKDGEYRFIHQIIQAVVYRRLGRQRCRLLHRRAGEVLEKLHPGDAAALARHFELAEEPGRAAWYALQAGLAAKAVYAHAEARAYFERSMTLLEGEAAELRDPEATANRQLRIRALYERGWALRLLGNMEAYTQDLQEVSRLAELLGDQCTLAQVRWREAYTHRWFCRYADALEAAEEGLCLSRAFGECTMTMACRDEGLRANCASGNCLFHAMCWREIGIAAREMGDYEQAQSALGLALDLYVQMEETVYEIHTIGNLSTLYRYLGEFEKAVCLSLQALERCEEAGLNLERRLPLGDLGAAAAAQGDLELARESLLESLSIARQIDDRTQEIFCLGHLGWLYVALGQPARALKHLQAGLTLTESVGSRAEQSWLLSGLAEANLLAGEYDRARVRAVRALELAQATGRPYDEGLARRILDRLEGG